IADREDAHLRGSVAGARSYRPKENPVKTAVVVPPGRVLSKVQRALQVAFRGLNRPPWSRHVQRDDMSVWLGQYEKVTSSQFPESLGSILNSNRVCWHHRFQWRQVGEHRRRTGKLQFPLPLNGLERSYRSLRAIADLFLDFGVHRA